MKVKDLIDLLQKCDCPEADIYIHHDQAQETGKAVLLKILHSCRDAPYTKGDNMLCHSSWDTKYPVIMLYGEM